MEWIGLLQSQPGLFYSFIFIIGLLVGSFLNVVIYRLPIMLERRWRTECHQFLNLSDKEATVTNKAFNLVVPASHCPKCHHKIRFCENIPVISFLFSRGRCNHCGVSISWRYPFVEIITALASLAVALKFGVEIQTLYACILAWGLVALCFIDFDTQLLPDDITLPLLWLGLLVNLNGLIVPLESALIGAVAGYLVLWTLYMVFKLATGKEGMGFGDFKLLSLLGAWLGWQMLPLILLLSSLVGALVGVSLILFKDHGRQQPIPFGPYLAIAGFIAMLKGQDIIAFYLASSGL